MNLIINTLYLQETTSPSILKNYFRQTVVCLVSAKLYNPETEVMLISNREIPQQYRKIFEDFSVSIRIIPYDMMIMREDYPRRVFFYKWCALYHLVAENSYENILCLDADCYISKPLQDLWEECKYSVLLYHIRHRYSHKQTTALRNAYRELFGESKQITSYGGEFIASKTEYLKEFLEDFLKLCNLIIEKNFKGSHGDEMVIDFTALLHKEKILDGGAYISRYWTGSFHLVSTNWYYDTVDIWHLPGEKQYGIIRMFHYIIDHKKLPKREKAAKILHLAKKGNKFFIRSRRIFLYVWNFCCDLFFDI